MAQALSELDSLTGLFETSSRPVYVVDGGRRIVYCNSALATWLDLEGSRIVGRPVEYHSEPDADRTARGDGLAPLADLCPPPRALAGEPCAGTISCLARGGGLVHRSANFVSLGLADEHERGDLPNSGVFVILSPRDLTAQELAAQLSAESPADELHRAIRQFRRAQAARYAIESLLGQSSAMGKVRSQVAAAAASGANTLICGRPGAGRGHIARAIHYRAAGDANTKLVPLDGTVANDDLLRRALDAVRDTADDARGRPTLLLENLDRLAESLQSQVATAIRQNLLPARVIATCVGRSPPDGATATFDSILLDAVSTITIDVPRLRDRLDDLPILAQLFLEASNRTSGRQVGSVRPDALDLLALYTWPGELDELREVIVAAHGVSGTHEIAPADLPVVVHHASKSAARVRRRPERIVLDELLANIEKEAIIRALTQTGGNKTEAAEMLGMTRPRLYRRLVQLGLAGPEFIESEPNDDLL